MGCTSMVVDARTLQGTNWRVTAINGQATPNSGRFRMSFDGANVSARFGCNSGGGGYTVSGKTLRPTGPMMATQMACAPATDEPQINPMTYERWGFTVLGKPMRMTWKSGRRLTLNNAAGSIELKRLP